MYVVSSSPALPAVVFTVNVSFIFACDLYRTGYVPVGAPLPS